MPPTLTKRDGRQLPESMRSRGAILVHANGDHFTNGLLTRDAVSQNVLKQPGLYAAGEVTGGIHGGNRIGGNAVGGIITFGRIAGENAAQYAKTH